MKYMLSFKWSSSDPEETREAMDLIKQIDSIGLEQVLSLLAGYFSLNPEYSSTCLVSLLWEGQIQKFKEIRALAVAILKRKVNPERLELISLQLVQALKYEQIRESYEESESALKDFLLEMAVEHK